MRSIHDSFRLAFTVAALNLLIAACGGTGGGTPGGGNAPPPPAPPPPLTFTVGGAVTGLKSAGLVLRNNGTDSLSIAASGTFTFGTPLASGASYAVTVATQPNDQNCTVRDGVGTANAKVDTIAISCSDVTTPLPPPPPSTLAIGGTVTGLAASGLVLLNNGTADLAISANGTFEFGARIASGATYGVSVGAQPTGQVCAVSQGNGVAVTDVRDIVVTCAALAPPAPLPGTVTIGGTVSGLAAPGLVLLNNGGDATAIPVSGPFVFAVAVAAGSDYAVTVAAEPLGQECAVSNARGTARVTVTTVSVVCADLPALVLTATTPLPDATNVSRVDPLTMTFSAAIDGSSVNARSVFVAGPEGRVDLARDVDVHAIELRPRSKLLPRAAYSMEAGGELRGLRGEAMRVPAGSTFTTQDGAWSLPVAIHPGGSGNNEAVVAMDRRGNAIAAWVASIAEGAATHYSTNDGISGWSASGSFLTGRPPSTARAPRVATDDRGHAFIVWGDTIGGSALRLWAQRLLVSGRGTGDRLTQLDANFTEPPSDWQLATNDAGVAAVAWSVVDGNSRFIGFNVYLPSIAGWSGAFRVSDSEGIVERPQLVATDDDVIVTWEKFDGFNFRLLANRYIVSRNTWSGVVEIGTPGVDSSEATLAADREGNVIVLWKRDAGTTASVLARRFDRATSQWQTSAVTVQDAIDQEVRNPKLAVNAQGDAAATWEVNDGTRYNALARAYLRRTDSWGAVRQVSISDASARSALRSRVGMDLAGNITVMWQQAETATSPSRVWWSRLGLSVPNADWSVPTTILQDPAGPDIVVAQSNPGLAVDASGDVTAVWLRSERNTVTSATSTNARAARFE